jgi:predicted dehydrogenase
VARLARAGPDGKAGDWQVFQPPDGFERNSMFVDEMRHFIEVARGKAEPICSLEEGVYALKLALAAGEAGSADEVRKIGGNG